MEPLTSFSGLATGLDTASIVDSLVALERRPIQRLEQKQGDLSAISRRLSDLKSNLTALSDAATALDDRAEVLLSSGSSTDDAISVTADGGAALGSYSLEVFALAQAQRTYTDPVAAKDQVGLFGEGDLTITVGTDAAVVVTIDATDTLETVASKINASGAGVSAGLLFDGTSYRLQVSSNETGLDRAVTFSEGGTLALDLDDPANVTQAAQDASFSIDGFAMTRSTNGVADAIPGVTLTLGAVTTAPATVSISRDPAALEEQVQTFVDAYNTVMEDINSEFVFGGNAVVGTSLSGDAMLRGLQSRLRTQAGAVLGGFTDPYNRLSGIGVELKSDGTLELDSEAFASALASNGEDVSRMLVGDATEQGLMSRFEDLTELYTKSGDGFIAQKIDSMDDQSRSIDNQIDRMEERIQGFELNLRRQFTAMEQLVSSLTSQGNQMLSILGQLES